jgi:CBS domain-containing protein
MSSLFLPSSWPFLAVVLLFALLLIADAWRSYFDKQEDGEDEGSPLEDLLVDLQYLHKRIREEDFRRAMFQQHQAMLDRPEDPDESDKLGISVEHLMTRGVLSVLPDTSRDEVTTAMQSIRSHHIIVCDDRDRLLGVVSDRDLAMREGDTAGEVMTPGVLSVGPHTSTAHALALMLRHRISCLPVVDEREQLVGVLTSSDMLLALSCYLELSAMLCAPPGADPASGQRRARSLRQNAPVGTAQAREALAGIGGRPPAGKVKPDAPRELYGSAVVADAGV